MIKSKPLPTKLDRTRPSVHKRLLPFYLSYARRHRILRIRLFSVYVDHPGHARMETESFGIPMQEIKMKVSDSYSLKKESTVDTGSG